MDLLVSLQFDEKIQVFLLLLHNFFLMIGRPTILQLCVTLIYTQTKNTSAISLCYLVFSNLVSRQSGGGAEALSFAF